MNRQMSVMEAIRERRSVRSYLPDPVPEEALKELLEAIQLAPSGSNRQDWHFIVVRDPEQLRKLATAIGQPFVGEAPLIIAAIAKNPARIMRGETPSYAVDLAITLTHVHLAAIPLGLGTCWIGAFDYPQAAKVLGVPAEYKLALMMTVGYPVEQPKALGRKPLSEIVSYERF